MVGVWRARTVPSVPLMVAVHSKRLSPLGKAVAVLSPAIWAHKRTAAAEKESIVNVCRVRGAGTGYQALGRRWAG